MIQQVYRFPDVVSGDTTTSVNFEILLNSVALDITGYVIKLNWLSSSGSVLKTLSTANGLIEITNGSAGQFTVNEYIASLPPLDYVSDMEFVALDDTVKTYLKVYMRVLKGYTT